MSICIRSIEMMVTARDVGQATPTRVLVVTRARAGSSSDCCSIPFELALSPSRV